MSMNSIKDYLNRRNSLSLGLAVEALPLLLHLVQFLLLPLELLLLHGAEGPRAKLFGVELAPEGLWDARALVGLPLGDEGPVGLEHEIGVSSILPVRW